jgi:hypothetical protein
VKGSSGATSEQNRYSPSATGLSGFNPIRRDTLKEEKMTNKIEVLDKIMGSGKSTAVLNWCEQSPDTSFLYVTPLLSESEGRVVDACKVSKFTAPTKELHRTKGEHLLDLLQSGANASITHEMYGQLKPDHLRFIKENKYTVILDEEVSFIEPMTLYTTDDFKYLRSLNQIRAEDDGKLVWLNDSELCDNMKYTRLANMCRLGMVYQSKRTDNWFVTQLPIDLIKSADRVIVITYLFKGSVMDSFVKLKGITVEDFKEVEVKEDSKQKIRDLIEFVCQNQCDLWLKETMSSSWFENANQEKLKKLAKSIRAVGDSCKVKSGQLLWCVPSVLARPKTKSAKKVAPSGYSAGTGEINEDGFAEGSFLPCSSRATNAYRNREVMVHAYNRFPNVTVSAFLQDYNAPVDNNQFALSEFLQWLWRSRIRDGQPIKVCILSRRMRKIFQDWLKED